MQHLQKTRGGGIHNFSHRSPPISHLPYTLPSSVSHKSFVCRSYENTRGVGVFFAFWNSSPSHPRSFFSCTYVESFLQALCFQIHAWHRGRVPPCVPPFNRQTPFARWW